tara:strand:+ start:375 stop:581 length:207 start_codon:yes stop_codon:yes gene_type:complete
MTIKIIHRCQAAADEHGSATRYYEVGDIVETGQPWQAKIAQSLVEAGYAAEAKVVAPKETKTKTKAKK